MRLTEQQHFAGYKIVRRLGSGGMASVYLASEESLGREVALKVMPPHLTDQPFFVERFEQEAAVIARLEHPNIIPLYRYGVEVVSGQQIPWMALRYVEGGELGARLRESPDRSAVLSWLGQLAAALDYAHSRGVVHRDLKPQNVLVANGGDHLYLADFGIAKILEGARIASPTGDTIFGTPEYMAPEQAVGGGISGQTDIYAFGIMVYEWLAGMVPFRADTPHATLLKHVQEPLPPAGLDHVPQAVRSAVRRATAKTASERFSTAGEFVNALRAGFDGAGTTMVARRSTSRVGVLLSGALILGAVVATYLWRSDAGVRDVSTATSSAIPVSSPATADSVPIASAPTLDDKAAGLSESGQPPADTAGAVGFAKSLLEKAALPPPTMTVKAIVSPERETYREGEKIEIGFVLEEAGYPAVFVHSQDGTTTLLYPNKYERAALVPAKRLQWVGSASQNFRIEIAPPFGTDVVQVVAFRRMDDLRLLLDSLSLGPAAEMYAVERPRLATALSVVSTRGMKVVAAPAATASGLQQPGWGNDEALIHTLPAVRNP
jgi:serine/threonine protein kinase